MKLGILGLGKMARVMCDTLVKMDDVERWAVGSRNAEHAKAFAAEYGFEKAYGSYEELVRDPEIKLIYIASPHSHHLEHTKLCLENGKHVLVEKAFTVNAAEAEELVVLAREKGLLLAEAIWTRFAPMRGELEKLIKDSPIGKIRMLSANLGYPVCHRERVRDPKLAGGALLDVGVYTLNFALMAFGTDIASVTGTMSPGETGVDFQNTITIAYKDGRMASLFSTIETRTDRRGVIMGDEGYIVCDNINNISGIHIYRFDGGSQLPEGQSEVRYIAAPEEISGYEYEVRAAMRAIREGRVECEEMPHEETLRVMRLMDGLRKSWGLRYPQE